MLKNPPALQVPHTVLFDSFTNLWVKIKCLLSQTLDFLPTGYIIRKKEKERNPLLFSIFNPRLVLY